MNTNIMSVAVAAFSGIAQAVEIQDYTTSSSSWSTSTTNWSSPSSDNSSDSWTGDDSSSSSSATAGDLHDDTSVDYASYDAEELEEEDTEYSSSSSS